MSRGRLPSWRSAPRLSLGDDLPGDGSASGSLSVGGGGTVTNGSHAYIGHFTGSYRLRQYRQLIARHFELDHRWRADSGRHRDFVADERFRRTQCQFWRPRRYRVNLRIRNLGDVNLNGGEIRVGDEIIYTDAGSTFNFVTGTLLQLKPVPMRWIPLSSIVCLVRIPLLLRINTSPSITRLRLPRTLRLNGGTFSVGAITPTNVANLDWDAGTLNVTAQNVVVGAGGQFGNALIVGDNQALNVPNNSITVDPAGNLSVIRGYLSSAAAVNSGLMVIAEADAVEFDIDHNDSGLVNNGDLVVVDTTITGNVVNNGRIETLGNVTFLDGISLTEAGSLGIDLNGLVDFDAISIGSDASLGGTLNVDVTGFTLTPGNSFKIIDIAGAQSGMFANLNDEALVGNFSGVDLFIDYDGGDGNDVVLFTGAGTAGDFDFDGDVDGRDFLTWQRNTSIGDLADWQANYRRGSTLRFESFRAGAGWSGVSCLGSALVQMGFTQGETEEQEQNNGRPKDRPTVARQSR